MPLKKNLNAFRPYEHRPARGETVKTFRWDQQAHVIPRITFSWAQNGSGARQSTDHPKKIGAKFPEIVVSNTARELFVQLGTTVVALCIYMCNFRSPKNCPAWFCNSRSVQRLSMSSLSHHLLSSDSRSHPISFGNLVKYPSSFVVLKGKKLSVVLPSFDVAFLPASF